MGFLPGQMAECELYGCKQTKVVHTYRVSWREDKNRMTKSNKQSTKDSNTDEEVLSIERSSRTKKGSTFDGREHHVGLPKHHI